MSSRKGYPRKTRSRSPQKSREATNSNRSSDKSHRDDWHRDRERSDRDRRPTHERERAWQGRTRDRQWQRDRYRSRSPQRYRFSETEHEEDHNHQQVEQKRERSRGRSHDRSNGVNHTHRRDDHHGKEEPRKEDHSHTHRQEDHGHRPKEDCNRDGKSEHKEKDSRKDKKHRHADKGKGSSAKKSRTRSRIRASKSRSHSAHSASPSSSDNDDADQEGIVQARKGDYIRDRYKVMGQAGQGTFGTVLDVLDTKHQERIALKVVRSVKRYLEAAYVEMDILEKIRQADPDKKSGCVRLYCTFDAKHRGQKHVCLGFEKLGRSLYEFIKKNKYRGFSLENVRRFGHQLVNSVAFCHSINLVHTDLKPENILLCDDAYELHERDGEADYRVPLRTDIRLIDFGGATFEKDHHSRIINTRQYRSPEVLLGLGWSYPSDLWSVGCILAELVTGELLFATHEDLEHLALMEKMLGQPLPGSMTREALRLYPPKRSRSHSSKSRSRSRAKSKEKKRARSSSNPRPDLLLHHETARLRWPDAASSRQSVKHVNKAKTLEALFPDSAFVDLLRKCLVYDTKERITAAEALKHPFFTGGGASTSPRSRDKASRSRDNDRRKERQRRNHSHHSSV